VDTVCHVLKEPGVAGRIFQFGQTDVVFHPESLLAVPVGAEQVVYPGGQHFQLERFGQIAVRSGFIAIYSVVRALFGCQHDDGDMAGFEL